MHLTNSGYFNNEKKPEDPEPHAGIKMAQVLGNLVCICAVITKFTDLRIFYQFGQLYTKFQEILPAGVWQAIAFYKFQRPLCRVMRGLGSPLLLVIVPQWNHFNMKSVGPHILVCVFRILCYPSLTT